MKKGVKKGFTIVEVVAALAILTSSIAIIYQVFNFSGTVWVKEKKNISLVSCSQTIAQTLKGSGKDHLALIYNDILATNGGTKVFIYFDSIADASAIIKGMNLANYNVVSNIADIYTGNTSGKTYGAELTITKLQLSNGNYAVYYYYQVDITVWELDKFQSVPATPEISTVSTFYIT